MTEQIIEVEKIIGALKELLAPFGDYDAIVSIAVKHETLERANKANPDYVDGNGNITAAKGKLMFAVSVRDEEEE